jgi:hypothetical protein
VRNEERTSLSGVPAHLRAKLGALWLEDARMKHASIAEFARFTLELLAWGAPAELVMQAQLAGVDAMKHAQGCFALAARYSGEARGPAEFPIHDLPPARTLRESVLSAVAEGCVGGALSAARARAALSLASSSVIRTLLERIADDEAKHAELAYRFVAWALKKEPSLRADVADCFDEACAHEPHGEWESWSPEEHAALRAAGRLTSEEARSVYRDTVHTVIRPCASALLRPLDNESFGAAKHAAATP